MRLTQWLRVFDIRTQLRKKLIVTYLLILLPALSIPAILYYNKSVHTVQNVMTQNMFEMTEIVNSNIESYLNDVEALTNAPYYSSEMQQILHTLKYKVGLKRAEAESALFNTIDVLLGLRKDIIGLYIFDDTNNRYYKTSIGDVSPFYSFVEQPWFSSIKKLKGDRLVISTHKADYFTNPRLKYVFSVGRSILSKETNEEIGLIYVDMDLEVIRKILSSLKNKENNEFLIIDKEGKLVYSYDEKNLGEPYSKQWLPAAITTDKGNYVTKLEGQRRLVTYDYSDQVGWWYITITNLEPLLQPNEQAIREIIIITTIALLALLLTFSLAVSSAITNPVKRLQKAMRQIENDNFRPVNGIDTKDEIGSLVLSYNEMVAKIADLINTVYKVTIKEREAQLNALQTQINPHFLYNTLNSISSMAEVHGVREISAICKAVSDLFRYSIKGGTELVPLGEEIASVKQYMMIQGIRYDNRIEAIFNVKENLLISRILKFTLQPLVENAVYHGLEPKRGKGLVVVQIDEDRNQLRIMVSDNGLGMDEEQLDAIRQTLQRSSNETDEPLSSKGIGLSNVHDRVRLYFGGQYGISIQSDKGVGTSVQLTMPIMDSARKEVADEDHDRR